MERIFTILILTLLAFLLSACDNKNSMSNTISVAELTDRENAILATTSEKSFVFNFQIDSEYKEASVWIEKYKSGKLVDDEISKITSQVAESGSIIFTTSGQKQFTYSIGINSKGGTGSTTGFDTDSNSLDNMSSIWGTFQGDNTSIEGEVVLATICYSDSESGMRSLSPDFYKDANGHMKDLEEYDVVYLIKTEFME